MRKRGIGRLIWFAVALLMAVVVAGGPAWANCDHGSHSHLATHGPAISTDDHCPLCDRAMPDVVVPVAAYVPPSIVRFVPSAPVYVARMVEGDGPLHSGRGPPRMS